METVSEPENLGLSEKQGIERVHGSLLQIILIIMQLPWLRPQTSFYGIDEMVSNMTDPKRFVYKWNIFFVMSSSYHLFTVWHIKMFLIFQNQNISGVFLWIVTNV